MINGDIFEQCAEEALNGGYTWQIINRVAQSHEEAVQILRIFQEVFVGNNGMRWDENDVETRSLSFLMVMEFYNINI